MESMDLKTELTKAGEATPELADKFTSLADKYENVGSLAKAYANLESKIGSMATLPDASDTDAVSELMQRYTPEEYELEFGELSSLKGEEIITDDFKGKLKELGLTNKQAQGMVELFHGGLKSKEESILQGKEASAAQVQDRLKAKYPDETARGKNVTMVESYLQNLLGEKLGTVALQEALQDVDGAFDSFLQKARKGQDDPGIGGGKVSTADNIENIKEEFLSIQRGDHKLFGDAAKNPRNPKHKAALAEAKRLSDQFISLT